jgi:hypothetical protein
LSLPRSHLALPQSALIFFEEIGNDLDVRSLFRIPHLARSFLRSRLERSSSLDLRSSHTWKKEKTEEERTTKTRRRGHSKVSKLKVLMNATVIDECNCSKRTLYRISFSERYSAVSTVIQLRVCFWLDEKSRRFE